MLKLIFCKHTGFFWEGTRSENRNKGMDNKKDALRMKHVFSSLYLTGKYGLSV